MNQAFLRRLIGSLAGICLTAGAAAYAADLPMRAPAPLPPPPVFTWTGAYFGVQVGGGWGQSKFNSFQDFGYSPYYQSVQDSGVFGGIHLGYNIQTGPLVIGLQAEYNFAGVTGNGYANTWYGANPWSNVNNAVRQFGSIDARVGAAFDRVLVYAIGGFAYADLRNNVQFQNLPSNIDGFRNYIDSRAGWDVGAGIEYALTDNWTARAEYRYYNWGTKNYTDAVTFGNGIFPPHSVQETLQTARVGLTYKFGSPAAPVVAKY